MGSTEGMAGSQGELTIDRLFDAPALAGPTIAGLKISPDGSRITYLQGKPEDRDCLDLWEYDTREGRAWILVNSRELAPVGRVLSNEDLSRRERQRTGHFPVSWSTPLRHPAMPCYFPSAAISIITI